MEDIAQTLQPFFIEEPIEKEEYARLKDIIAAIKACTHIMPGSFYIIDFHKRDFCHVFEEHFFLAGYSPQDVRRMGLDFYRKCIPEKESNMVCAIIRAGFERFNLLPEQTKMDYSLFCNFHLKRGNIQTLVNHRVTPLRLYHGKLWLALCTLTPAACNDLGRVFLHKHEGDHSTQFYDLKEGIWREFHFVPFTDMEKRIILCTLKGMTIPEIATEVNRTVYAVKKARETLVKKSGTTRFLSLCHLALQHQLL